MRDTFARTLHEVAKSKPGVFIVVADISPAGSMTPFREDFPNQFINVGVAEQGMIGICAGLAQRGCTPFAYTIATFAIYRPFEQIRNDLCYQNLPVTVVGVGAGVSYANHGGTHHAQEDIALMSALPNMSIIAPCDPLETAAATWACASHTGPVYLRLGKAGEPDLTGTAAEPFVFGKVRLIKDGKKVCIISYGPILKMASDLASGIENSTGEPVALVSAHTLKPLDKTGILDILKRFETVVVVEEHSTHGGLGTKVKEIAWDSQASTKLHTFGMKDEFLHFFGSQTEMWKLHGLSINDITAGVEKT